jgi:predicted CoA-binding protein
MTMRGLDLSDDALKSILTRGKRIAVIGLSPVPARPSYGVTRYMISHGYEIYGVRPASPSEILGRPCYESLSEVTADIDIFDIFRNADAVPGVVEEIKEWIKKYPRPSGPKRVLWLQEGVGNPEAEKAAQALGLEVVSDLCILKEHARLI